MTGVRAPLDRLARRVLRSRAVGRAIGGTEAVSSRLDDGAPPALTILTYHRVGPEDAIAHLAPTLVTASVEDFRGHMDVIRDVATPVSLRDVLRALDGQLHLPDRSVLVTFDDGYCDFPDTAWPVLVERDIPAVMFVPTAYPSDPTRAFWWDALWLAVADGAVPPSLQIETEGLAPMAQFRALRDRVLSAPGDEADALIAEIIDAPGAVTITGSVMGWGTISDLVAQGLEIGAHTHTHAPLHQLTFEEARAEIERSIHELRSRGFHDNADVLAYPGGGHSEQVRAAAAAAGVRLAMTTERGTNRLDAMDPLRLRRINVGRSTTPGMLRAQLAPSLARIRRWACAPS